VTEETRMVSAAWSVSFTKAGKAHDCVTRSFSRSHRLRLHQSLANALEAFTRESAAPAPKQQPIVVLSVSRTRLV
jgi:hypothetical protein